MIGLVCALCLVPLVALHAEGYQRFIRRLQGDVAAAVRDVTDFAESGFVSYVEVEAASAQTGQTIKGRYEVLGSTAPDMLVVRPVSALIDPSSPPTSKPTPPSHPPPITLDPPIPKSAFRNPKFSLHPRPALQRATSRCAALPPCAARRSSSGGSRSTSPGARSPTSPRSCQQVRSPQFSYSVRWRSLARAAPHRGQLRLAEAAHVAPEGAHYATVEASAPRSRSRLPRSRISNGPGSTGAWPPRARSTCGSSCAAGQAEHYGAAPRTRAAAASRQPTRRATCRASSCPSAASSPEATRSRSCTPPRSKKPRPTSRMPSRWRPRWTRRQPQDAIETARYRTSAVEARATLERLQSSPAKATRQRVPSGPHESTLREAEARLAAHEAQSLARREAFTARRRRGPGPRAPRPHESRKTAPNLCRDGPARGTLARVDTLRTSTTRHELRLHIE